MQHQTEAEQHGQTGRRNAVTHRIAAQHPDCWYVAYTEARKETVAQFNLEQQHFLVYLPLYKTIRKRNAHTEAGPVETFEPMFPRYIFFRPSSQQQSISTVRSTRGVLSVVRFGADMAQVQPETIASIRELEALRKNVDLSAGATLRPGSPVRISEHAFSGLEGLVHSISAQRIVVLMEILGRQTKVKVRRTAIEPA